VVVLDDRIVSSGYHFAAGCPHAEVNALDVSCDYRRATLYVTLEPCCHFGSTPPCTDLIINKGINRVVFSLYDPNPLVLGQGQQVLRSHGIDCVYLPLAEVSSFYEDYVYWRRRKRSWVTAKLAMTNNRMIAHEDGSPMSITGAEVSQFTHRSRKIHSALLTSVNTVLADNPRFNVRLDHEVIQKTVLVVDRSLRLPRSSQLLSTAKELILLHTSSDDRRIQSHEREGIECWYVGDEHAYMDLDSVLRKTALRGYHSLWLECGGQLLASFLAEKRLQRLCLAVSPCGPDAGMSLCFKSIVTTPKAVFGRIEDLGLDTLFVLDFLDSIKTEAMSAAL